MAACAGARGNCRSVQSAAGRGMIGRASNITLYYYLAFLELCYSPLLLVTLNNSVFSAGFAALMRKGLLFSNQ